MNNGIFGKTMKNVRKHRDLKFVITGKRRNYFVLEPNYYTIKCFTEKGLAMCFIVLIKTDDIYKDIAEDVETRFDTSNYELERPLPKGKKKNVIYE